MTSRETLAIAVVAAPALAALVAAAAPRRAVAGVAAVGAVVAAALALGLAAVALTGPEHPLVHKWIVVDAAAGLLVGVIGVVGLASVLVSPAYLATAASGLVRAERRERLYYALLFVFWALLAAIPLVGNLGGAWLLVEATTAASALLVGFSGRPRALEAGWKYLILTSLGLGVALLGIVLLAAGSAHGGLDALSWRDLGHVRGRARDAGRVPPAPRGPGVEDRLGAGPQLAPGCPLRGPRSGFGSALGGPSAGRAPDRLALEPGAQPGDRRLDGTVGARRVRPALPGRRGAVPVAAAAVETAARLLEPRAHGRDRPRHRLRHSARPRRRRRAHRRARARQGTRLLRCNAVAGRQASRVQPRGERDRQDAARARRRDGHLARRARRPAALAAVRERGADRRRRLCCGTALDRVSRRRAPGARLPRPRTGAHRDARRPGRRARPGLPPGLRGVRIAHRRHRRLPPRPDRGVVLAARRSDRSALVRGVG